MLSFCCKMVHSRNSLFNFQATQMTENEQQKINSTMSQLVMNQHRPGQLTVTTDFDNTFGLPAACLLTAKMYEEERLKHPTGNFDPNLRSLDANKLRLPNSAAISLRYFRDMFVTLYHINLI